MTTSTRALSTSLTHSLNGRTPSSAKVLRESSNCSVSLSLPSGEEEEEKLLVFQLIPLDLICPPSAPTE